VWVPHCVSVTAHPVLWAPLGGSLTVFRHCAPCDRHCVPVSAWPLKKMKRLITDDRKLTHIRHCWAAACPSLCIRHCAPLPQQSSVWVPHWVSVTAHHSLWAPLLCGSLTVHPSLRILRHAPGTAPPHCGTAGTAALRPSLQNTASLTARPALRPSLWNTASLTARPALRPSLWDTASLTGARAGVQRHAPLQVPCARAAVGLLSQRHRAAGARRAPSRGGNGNGACLLALRVPGRVVFVLGLLVSMLLAPQRGTAAALIASAPAAAAATAVMGRPPGVAGHPGGDEFCGAAVHVPVAGDEAQDAGGA